MSDDDEHKSPGGSAKPPDNPSPSPAASNRKAILARRARFLTAALAGAGIVAATEGCEVPRPCLSPVVVTAEPMPGVSPIPEPEQPDAGTDVSDAGADAAPEGSAGAASPAPDAGFVLFPLDGGGPRVCLRYAPRPSQPRPPQPGDPPAGPPRPCLSPPAPPPAPDDTDPQ